MKKHNGSLSYFKNVIIPVLIYSGISGVLVGVLVNLYTFAANWLTHESVKIYELTLEHLWAIPILLLGLVVIALIVSALLKVTPECSGSGVPRTEGVLRGLLTFRWLRVLFTTITASILTYASGMSLGSEGPSIQIGATTATGACKMMHCRLAWTRYVQTGGACAGLAVAFNAPLTGIVFALEEVHKKITPMILLSASSSVLFATLVSNALSSIWGNGGYVFDMGVITALPTKNFYILILLGIACGVLAVVFNQGIIKSQKLTNKLKVPQWLKLVIAFLVCGIAGLLCLDSLGGGHGLILKIGNMDFALKMLIILFVLKMFLIILSFNSGATGGLFVPMLAIGALIGGIFGKICLMAGLDEIYYKTIVVISMTAFFGASVRAPITAMVLIVEVTGHLNGFLMTGFAICTAYFVAELFNAPPLYDALLENILKTTKHKNELAIVTFSVEIMENSFAVSKCVRDILWPPNCLVLTLNRGEIIIVPDGETKLHAGDKLNLQAETFDLEETQTYLNSIIT